jgi:succinoglycan biosynthesis transport protein ExoP
MLQFNRRHPAAEDYRRVTPEEKSPQELLEHLLGIVRRQYAVILFVGVLTMALALIYVVTATPRFVAVATMFIDRGKVQPFSQQQLLIDSPIDSTAIESQIEIIKSDAVALSVINNLHLTDDPEFGGPISKAAGTKLGFFSGLFHLGGQSSSSDLSRNVLESFKQRVSATRVGYSFVIAISFISDKPERAAQIANSIVEAYINDQLEARYEVTRRANVWLQGRLEELERQTATSDRAVADFKAKNNLVDVGKGQSADEQMVSQLNTQLLEARAQTSTAKARLDRIDQIITAGNDAQVTGTVAETLNNGIISQLRTRYLELVNREADLSARVGSNHLAVVNMQRQIREIKNSILDELKRIFETYKSDFEIAKQRQADVEKRLASAVSDSQSAGQAQGALNELESKAKSYHSLYDNLLQRYTELTQQESLPMTEARFVTRASPPQGKAYPKTRLVLAGALFAGLALGFGVGFLREMLDSVFRTTKQVVAALNTNCLAVIPLAEGTPASSSSEVPGQKLQLEPAGLRTIIRRSSIMWTVNDTPLSRFAEAVRAVKLAVDLSVKEKSKIIGITSAIPDEGKSTISANLALLTAQVGARVLLVDGDLRNPSLSRALAPGAKCGIFDVISGQSSLEEVVWTDPSTGLAFLPAIMPFRLTHSNEFFSSDLTKLFFKELRHKYDYIIVDLSPLVPVIDVRATTDLMDAYVLVVEWGRTKIKLVEHALSEAETVYENLLGVILNKANMDKVHRYDGYLEGYYRNKHFARYYAD